MTVATFNGSDRIITLASGVPPASGVNLTNAESEMYSEWKRFSITGDNLKFAPAFRTIGGDPLGGSIEVGAYFFLQNQPRTTAAGGWVIKPPEHDGFFEIEGNIFGEDANEPVFSGTAGDFSSVVRLSTSSLTQLATLEGVAAQVWAATVSENQSIDSFGEFVAKLLTVAKFIGLK